MKQVLTTLGVAVTFVWAGFVGAISFMEAWLKFTAPGVTLVTGLSIGKVIFTTLNRVEIVFALVLLITLIARKAQWSFAAAGLPVLILLILFVILFVQSIWILPPLSARIDLYLAGNTPRPSDLHFYSWHWSRQSLSRFYATDSNNWYHGEHNQPYAGRDRPEKL